MNTIIMKKYISIIATLLFTVSLAAQNPVPAKKQTKSILLMNGVAHIGNGKVIQNSVIGFKDGKIKLIGDATLVRINKTEWDTVIDVYGKQVYPGFIAPNSTLGLTDIDAVRATNDFHDIDGMNPHVRSQSSYNTDSKIQPTVRTNGILTAQVTPRGGRISGTSSIMSLDGWNWLDATLRADDGVHLNWPSWYSRSWNEDDGFSAYSQNKNYETQKQALEKFFTEAQAYYNNAANPEKNLRFEAMKNVFASTENLYIHADLMKEINEAVYFSVKFNLTARTVIVGGSDSWQCTDLLKQYNIPVMLTRVHTLPLRNDDDVDQPYKTAKELNDAGILFCIQNEGDMEAMGARNLPFLAGTCVAYGLNQETAISALTLNSAKILHVDDLIGSLEENKDATLFVSDGDALDMKTNKVTLAFIQGKLLDLTNDQQALYERYEGKYNLKDQ